MKEISLTQGKFAFVNDEDYERLNQHKWYAIKCKNSFYAVRQKARLNGKRSTILMHREIANTIDGYHTDHKNGDTLDNQRDNLRDATCTQNCQNKKYPHKDNKLGIKGVRWNKKSKKFTAQIQINKKLIHLGSFNVMGDADSAYRIAEEKYFGEYARKE